MSNTSFLRKSLFLALPVAVQMLLQSMLGMADVAMVSSLGQEAVAAVGLASKLHFLLLVLMIGIASAGGALIAQYTGAKSILGVQKTLGVTLFIGVLVGLPLLVLFLASHVWMQWLNPDESVVGLAAQFLVITAPVLLFTQVTVIYEAALRATGDVKTPLMTGSIAVVLNVFFNYVLIFGAWGMPAFGVMGAAWGTLLARLIQVVILCMWVYGTRHVFALNRLALQGALNKKEVRRFFFFALPMVANYGLWGLGNTLYHILVGFAGTQALAVMGVMVPIESAFFSIFMGVSSACSVLIGQALGAGDNHAAKQLQRKFVRLVLVSVIVFALLLWVSGPYILSMFGALQDSSVGLLTQAIAVFCGFALFKVMNMLLILGVLRAGGDNKFCLVVDTLVMWAVGLPIFALAVYLGAPFLLLYALLSLEDVIKIWPFMLRVKRGVWLRNLAA